MEENTEIQDQFEKALKEMVEYGQKLEREMIVTYLKFFHPIGSVNIRDEISELKHWMKEEKRGVNCQEIHTFTRKNKTKS